MASDEWVLYVDESGDFGPGSYSCVVGWAMREQESGELGRQLRAAVEACFPLVPWPPHASALNIPVSQAAACLLSEGGHDDVRAMCAPAVEMLRGAREEPALRPFWRSVDRGRMPAFAELNRADAWLGQVAAPARERLRFLSARGGQRMSRLLRGLARSYGADDVFVVGAVQRGWASAAKEDGYLRCLEALFERLIALIDADGVRQAVRFRVATRHVEEVTLGVRLPLNAKHVVDLAQEARACAARLIDAQPGVRCVPLEHETRYDARVHAGVVLADFVANRARRTVGQANASWSQLRKAVRDRSGLAPEARGRRFGVTLPALAFEGPLRDWLTQAGAGGGPPPTLAPRWATEQARRWAEAVRER